MRNFDLYWGLLCRLVEDDEKFLWVELSYGEAGENGPFSTVVWYTTGLDPDGVPITEKIRVSSGDLVTSMQKAYDAAMRP